MCGKMNNIVGKNTVKYCKYNITQVLSVTPNLIYQKIN